MTTFTDEKMREEAYKRFGVMSDDSILISQVITDEHADFWLSKFHQYTEELKQNIKALGHQQEDDTVWCNMDEVLSLLDNTK